MGARKYGFRSDRAKAPTDRRQRCPQKEATRPARASSLPPSGRDATRQAVASGQTSVRAGSATLVPRDRSFAVLVERDQLYFRFVRSSPRDAISEEQTTEVGMAFRSAFAGVWGSLPAPDRHLLLGYWRRPPRPLVGSEVPAPPRPRPLISLVCVGAPAPSIRICDRLGDELIFPTSLVQTPAHRLPVAIARLLAEVYRLATGEHGRLVMALLEDPYHAWERRRGSKATEADGERQWARLEAAFLVRNEAEVTRVMQQWGWESVHCSPP